MSYNYNILDQRDRTKMENYITEKVAEIVAGAPDDFNTLKEMYDWLTEHEDSAAAMNTAIQANTTNIATNTIDIEENTSDISTLSEQVYRNLTALGYEAGKNLLKNTGTTRTVSGVTFTVNSDGSITVNGTATATAFFEMALEKSLPEYDLILSGCPAGGHAVDSYSLRLDNASGIMVTDTGEGVTLSASASPETATKVVIRIASGYTADNLVFYPMLRYANILDDEYEPHNESLNEKIEDIATTYHDLDLATTTIDSGDLNDYTDIGTYRTVSGSSYLNIENCPVQSGFKLVVEMSSTVNRRLQTIYTSTGETWTRNGNVSVSPSEWSEWGRVITTKDLRQAELSFTNFGQVSQASLDFPNGGLFALSVNFDSDPDGIGYHVKTTGTGVLYDGEIIFDVIEWQPVYGSEIDSDTTVSEARYIFTYDASNNNITFSSRTSKNGYTPAGIYNGAVTLTPVLRF